MLTKALETKALLVAAINPGEAAKAAQEYFAAALPVSSAAAAQKDLLREQQMRSIQDMQPIPLSSMRFGGTEMAPPR